MFSLYLNPPKTINGVYGEPQTPLSAKGAFMVLGCVFMVFSGVIVLVDLREVGGAGGFLGECWRLSF